MITKKCLNCGKEFQVRNYRKDTARFCCRSCGSSYNYAQGLGKCTHEHLKGNKFRVGKKPSNSFKKGHKPWNKGLKGIHQNPNTEFKKGNTPKRHYVVGTIKERKDKFGKIRNFIKIKEPNIWQFYAVYLWEQKNGKVPKGSVIHHINKISNDDRLDNLICLTREEHINIHRKDLENGKRLEGEF